MGVYDIRDARLYAVGKMPYLRRLVMSTILVETPGIGTMGTDCHWRLHYDPAVFTKWSLAEAGGVVVHECLHCLYKHGLRAKAKIGSTPADQDRRLFNVAGDYTINAVIRDSNCPLPKEGLNHRQDGYPDNLSVEEYFDLLKASKKEPPEPPEGMDGGSSADGQPRDWEKGPPSSGDPQDGNQGAGGQPDKGEPGDSEGQGGGSGDSTPGVSEYEQAAIARAVAQDIVDHARTRGRGSVPAGLLRAAADVLSPHWDPRREIMAQVRYSLTCTKGYSHTTWKQPGRRTQPSGARFPKLLQYVPQPIVIIDTSGSMDRSDLALALGVVGDVIKALPNQLGVHVITGDTCMAHCQRVFGATQTEMHGGGGTDMGRVMQQAVEKYPRADVVIVVTDGETPWPRTPLRQRCLALVTRQSRHYPIPSWIRRVYIRPGDAQET